jgi:hypothetical protein
MAFILHLGWKFVFDEARREKEMGWELREQSAEQGAKLS